MKKTVAVLICLLLAAGTLVSCKNMGQDGSSSHSFSQEESQSQSESSNEETSSEAVDRSGEANAFLEKNFPSNGEAELLNFKEPAAGEEIVVIKTKMGEMKARLFPEVAPIAVENFKKLIQNGYYNSKDGTNMTFHRIINNFMIQGGDPTGTGSGGASASGQPFENEVSEKALNFRGALSMVNSGPNTNASQFFVVQAPQTIISNDLFSKLKTKQGKAFPIKVMEKYKEVGGAPWLDFQYTVFGQVYEGLNILDQIAGVEVNESNRPMNDVIIESISIEKKS